MRQSLDLIGKKFGSLLVVDRKGSNNQGNSMWLCLCECGSRVVVNSQNLKSNHTRSCGCLRSQVTTQRNRTHNMSKTRLYRIWSLMKDRCKNPNTPCYSRYGKRGIAVCGEWTSFENFARWALANGYSDKLSIDRIDFNGNYEPANCRWIPLAEQNQNIRKNRFASYQGETLTFSQWSKELNMSPAKFRYLIEKGKTVQEIISEQKGD